MSWDPDRWDYIDRRQSSSRWWFKWHLIQVVRQLPGILLLIGFVVVLLWWRHG